jgi:MinD superfamily P-loop ATPase
MLKIAVLSGKGGTGKTTISCSLFSALDKCCYVDCDVEEPNGFLFLKPDLTGHQPVNVPVPEINDTLCTSCGACVDICQFNALAMVQGKVLLFEELCHHCGACALACKPMAITEIERTIGTIDFDREEKFLQGRLNIGEPAGVPIIRDLGKKAIKKNDCISIIFDCPPGASCAVAAVLDFCDYALIVTEPTPFGLHDLKIAAELVKLKGKACGIVINKSGDRDRPTMNYCTESGLDIVLKLPYDRGIASSYARGILPVENNPELINQFRKMYDVISDEVRL